MIHEPYSSEHGKSAPREGLPQCKAAPPLRRNDAEGGLRSSARAGEIDLDCACDEKRKLDREDAKNGSCPPRPLRHRFPRPHRPCFSRPLLHRPRRCRPRCRRSPPRLPSSPSVSFFSSDVLSSTSCVTAVAAALHYIACYTALYRIPTFGGFRSSLSIVVNASLEGLSSSLVVLVAPRCHLLSPFEGRGEEEEEEEEEE